MYYKMTHLTEDVFHLEFLDGSISSGILLSETELAGLEEILAKRVDLDVHESTEEWYTY